MGHGCAGGCLYKGDKAGGFPAAAQQSYMQLWGGTQFPQPEPQSSSSQPLLPPSGRGARSHGRRAGWDDPATMPRAHSRGWREKGQQQPHLQKCPLALLSPSPTQAQSTEAVCCYTHAGSPFSCRPFAALMSSGAACRLSGTRCTSSASCPRRSGCGGRIQRPRQSSYCSRDTG